METSGIKGNVRWATISGLPGRLKNDRGFSLIELIVVMALFALIMGALYSSFDAQVRLGITKEFREAESEVELGISRHIIERDISMAGYGIPEPDGPGTLSVTATEGAPDTLTLRGTGIGRDNRASQTWSYVNADATFSYAQWQDGRENLQPGSRVIIMNPATKQLVTEGAYWLFQYNGPSAAPAGVDPASNSVSGQQLTSSKFGDLVYGIGSAGITQQYHAVRYYLGGAPPSNCAPNTFNLLRAESSSNDQPGPGPPLLNCVADFQVALGLDTIDDDNTVINLWDNGGVTAAGYEPRDFNRRLVQVRAYILVQEGARDPRYTYSNPDPAYASKPDTIRVGELGLTGGAVGADYQLSALQSRYKWRVLSVVVTPRNIR